MSKLFKRTKILATVGPAVSHEDTIDEMVRLGVNGYRLNFSHGNYEERDQQIAWIRNAAEAHGKSVAILQDLQGPKIRLGMLKDNHYDVVTGDHIVLDSAATEHDGGSTLPVQYNLAKKVKEGELVFIYDGKVRTRVVKILSETAIELAVENDGYVMSKKGLNLPDTDFGGDVITEKDMADIEFGASRDFDFVAMSFIQSVDDVRKLRQILVSLGSSAKIIAKIETKLAIASDEIMEEIVKETDGIMVARGDLAVEAGAEVVPVVQLALTQMCRKYGKVCIVATQMLGSMVDNPEPTRAEISDIANAVMQGADCVMLSDETANGKYPLEAIRAMRKTILYTQEKTEIRALEMGDPSTKHTSLDAVSQGAVILATRLGVDTLVCETGTGATAMNVAMLRPMIPIISITDNQRVANQLSLCYANSSFVRAYTPTYGPDLLNELKEKSYFTGLRDGMLWAVIVSGRNRGAVGGADTIQLKKV